MIKAPILSHQRGGPESNLNQGFWSRSRFGIYRFSGMRVIVLGKMATISAIATTTMRMGTKINDLRRRQL